MFSHKYLLFGLVLILLSSCVSATMIDSFNRANEGLDGSTADNGNDWYGGEANPSIVSNEVYISGAMGGYEYLDLDTLDATDNYNISFEIETENVASEYIIGMWNGATTVIFTRTKSGYFTVNDGGTWKNVQVIVDDTIYNITFYDIDYGSDEFYIDIDGVGYGPYDFWNNVAQIDKFSFLNTVAQDSYLDQLQTSEGSGPTPSNDEKDLIINIESAKDQSNNLNATVEIENYDNFTITSGTVTTNITLNATKNYNITIYNITQNGRTYFNNSKIEVSLSNSTYNYNTTVRPYILLKAYDGYSANQVTSFTTTYDGNNYSSDINGLIYLPSFNETINLSTFKTGNYFTTETINHSSFNDLNVTLTPYTNITSTNIFTGGSLENLNITYYDISNPYTIYEVNMTGENGYLPLYNAVYNVTVHGNLSVADSTRILNASPYLEEANFTHYYYNSVNVNILNFHNQSDIDQLVTIDTISSIQAMTNTTTNGSIWLNFLTPTDYEIRFKSVGFVNTTRFFTVTDFSTQNITVYLQKSNATEIQNIIVLDSGGKAVEGAIVRVKREHLNDEQVFQEVQEVETNSEGKTAIYIERDTTVFYTFSIIYDGEARPIEPNGDLTTTKTFFVPNVIETVQFIINLEDSEIEGALLDQYAITTDIDVTNTTVTYYFIDGRNTITGGKLNIYGKYLTNSSNYELLSTQTIDGFEGTLTYDFPIVNNTIYKIEAFYVRSGDNLVYSGLKRFDANVIIEKETGLILAVMVLLVVALLTVTTGIIVSLLFTFGSLIPLTMLNFIDLPISAITSLLALTLILFVRLRRK